LGGEEGEARVLLRSRPASPKLRSGCFEAHRAKESRADKATAKQNTMASERAASPRLRSRRFEARSAEKGFRPTGVQEGATGLPVGLHRDHTAKPQKGRKSAKRVVEIPFRVLADFCAFAVSRHMRTVPTHGASWPGGKNSL